jgi:hypothetical protein
MNMPRLACVLFNIRARPDGLIGAQSPVPLAAGSGVDDELLAEPLREPLADQPCRDALSSRRTMSAQLSGLPESRHGWTIYNY